MSRRRPTPIATKDIQCPKCSIHLLRIVLWPRPRNVEQFGRRNTSTFVASDGNSYQMTFEARHGAPVGNEIHAYRGVRARCPECSYDLILNKRSVQALAEAMAPGNASTT